MKLFLLFAEGVVSALSPCVLPILPLYIGYLSQNAKRVEADGTISYKRSTVLLYTLFFVLGITMTFFILTLTMISASNIFAKWKVQFIILGGVFVFCMGLVQLGVIQIPWLQKEHRLPKILNLQNMNYLTAFMMGFLFSFAWTPCIGPALGGVLMVAASAGGFQGAIMILCYAAGFLIPFLVLALFTNQVLRWLKEKQSILKYTIKVGGIILLCMGVFMMNEGFTAIGATSKDKTEDQVAQSELDFTLQDQYGKTHSLSSYQGKPVFMTFFATWCGYCKQELVHIQEIYEERDDVVILGVIMPGNGDLSKDEIIAWLDDLGYTFPVLFDETGNVFRTYGVSSFPNNFFVKRDGEFYGYAPTYLGKEDLVGILDELVAQ